MKIHIRSKESFHFLFQMMQKRVAARKLLLMILAATCSISIVASSTSRERRHVGVEEAVHRAGRTLAGDSDSFKSSTGRDNEITTEVGRKVSHRLIGGHLRGEEKTRTQEAFWDDDILSSSSGNGKETRPGRKDEDDEKKSLSQQVKEGKYGLIQNEIYGSPKRPGIISYLGNPEVPKDTIENLGGLDEEEIWLAENHVLVLRGGKFPGHEATQSNGGDNAPTWPPIDDYKAPRRQVKIPSKPKVPPPFPVQLSEGGPVQIIGPNGTKDVGNGTVDYRDSFLTKGLLSEDGPFFTIVANGSVVTSDSRNASSEDGNLSEKEGLPDASPPGFPPFYHAIPPGAVFVPPPSNNQSDYDEEDQSVYYPPPYSFHYQQDNATAVPPGPLVPGIILPPPPDFFSALEESKKTTTKKYTKRPETTPSPRPRPTYLPPRKLTTKRYKSTTTTTTAVPIVDHRASGVTKVFGRIISRKNYTDTKPSAGPRTELRTVPYVEVTTSTPDKSTTLENPEFFNIGPLAGNQVTSGGEGVEGKKEAWSGLVTSKTIPVMAYYATSTQSTLERPVEVTPASIKSIITTGNPQRSHSQASYYFYEESNEQPLRTTPPNPVYYETTTESPFYETRPHGIEERRKQYYRVEAIPSREEDVRFSGSPVKNSGPIRYGESTIAQSSSKYESSSARAHGQRMLPDHAPLYYQTVSARPPPVQPYYTTSKPVQAYYRQEAKPKPIYQYSFEAADYSKRGGNRRQQGNAAYRNDYQNVQIGGNYNNGPRYDYEESVPQKRIRTEVYKNQHPIFQSSTAHSVISTTENPQQRYYTRQEEKLLDDVTKEYFTIFGKKIGKNVPSTTPLYPKLKSVTETPSYNVNSYAENFKSPEQSYKIPNVKVHYGDQSQKPYSLKEDILVNERQPLPPINPDSEFITVVDHQRQPSNYGIHDQSRDNQALAPIRAYPSQPLVSQRIGPPNNNYVPVVESPEELDDVAYPQLPISLEDDIKVNYRDPRPTINPDAELIDLGDDIKVNYRDPRPTLNPDAEFIEPILPARENQPEKPKAYFAYRLPGDGGHFYFLTPQAITQRPEQRSAGHLYSRVGTRLPRRRRRPGNV